MSSEKKTVLVVGATRGLGASIAKNYADSGHRVIGTARSQVKDAISPQIEWVSGIGVGTATAGTELVKSIKGTKIDIVVFTAGLFTKESFDEPNLEAEVDMYRTSAIGPIYVIRDLVKGDCLGNGSKVILVSSEAGSIALRHESEGGGLYGHHASKAATNMTGRLLAFDLKDKGIAVGMVHPGFMRTEMTRAVGFDQFWDSGGAVTPDEAANSLVSWIETFDMTKTGQFWAPRGAADIGTAEAVLGPKKDLPTPLQLPW